MNNRATSIHTTECGIPGIGQVPYGLHLCHFYPNREQLAEGLLAYFKAGLRNNERCIWVAGDPLPVVEIHEQIAATGGELADALRSGQLMLVDARDWYRRVDNYDAPSLVRLWADAEKEALSAGHAGLRVTGNTSFLQAPDWAAFMEYERALTPNMAGHRILALCSYNLEQCRPADVLDVMRHHHVTLEKADGGWQVQHDNLRLPRAGMLCGHTRSA